MDRIASLLIYLMALQFPALPASEPASAEPQSAPAAFEAAEVTEQAVDLDELVAEALARSPALAAVRSEIAARREMEAPAGALPDPMVEVMLQNIGFESTIGREDMSMLGVQARLGLPYPGKRAANRDVAAAETARALASLATLERSVAAEVRTLYARIWALERERETLDAATELAELLEQIALTRYASGEGDQEGVLKIQLQELRIAERKDDLARQRAGTLAELNRWLDRPGQTPIGLVADLPAVPPIEPDAEARALAGSTEIALAAAEVLIAERRVALARLELKPNFSAGGGLASRGGRDPVVLLGFGVELPAWRRQKQLPILRAAEHELEAARRQRADREASVRAEATSLFAAWTNANAQSERYRQGILPQTSTALAAARTAYLTGRGDFSTVIEDFNLWLEARVALARREADRFEARVSFDRLTGSGSALAGSKE